jgi:hypothetical protein
LGHFFNFHHIQTHFLLAKLSHAHCCGFRNAQWRLAAALKHDRVWKRAWLVFGLLLTTDIGMSSERGREFRAANSTSDQIFCCYDVATGLMEHFCENAI